METDEILLILAVAIFAGACLFRKAAPQGAAPPAQDMVLGQPVSNFVQGPAYLVSNAPWLFAPPIGNVLPATTSGLLGQVSWGPSMSQQGIN